MLVTRTSGYRRTGRHGALLIFALVYVGLSFATRAVLLLKAADVVSWNASLLGSFAWGLVFDLGAAAWCSLPLIAALTVLPSGFFQSRHGRYLVRCATFGVIFLLVFQGVAEWFFWDEFGTRFNFIAVDYLIYTTEVLNNIKESYPLPSVFLGVFLTTVALDWALWQSRIPQRWIGESRRTWNARLRSGALFSAGALALGLVPTSDLLPRFENNYNRSLAQNGLWSLVSAFRDNELDYEEFYATNPIEDSFRSLREELTEDGSILLGDEARDTLRYVPADGSAKLPNIVQITVESLSANFLSAFNPESQLTPHLDALVEKSLFFDNFYATGTRTVRGMEALTMSIPPTPGRSIVKRPDNASLFTLGSVLRARGYDTSFLYGGMGYFDNMNAFFAGNGYRVVDRSSVGSAEVTFANAWGACDEDLYRWSLREADRAYERGEPFHQFVMTTSNHRPYSFPEGKIDLPSKTSGRAGAVKYTDYAIGEFLRLAAKRPWFEETIFVIVADHCAGSAGRTQLPLSNYHIPLLIYAPGGQIEPGRNSTLMSQIDFAPTLLGLLNWGYSSRFFGHDITRIESDAAHALVSTYQLLGHLEHDQLTILEPKKTHLAYHVDPRTRSLTPEKADAELRNETVAFYQVASDMYKRNAYRELTPEEESRYCTLGERISALGVR